MARTGATPEATCATVLEAMLPERPCDDIALLVARTRQMDPPPYRSVGSPPAPFSPETEHRVRAAVEELGYRIDPFARGLRSQRTGTIALVLPNVYQPFNAELAEQVIRAPETQGLKVVVETTRSDAERERAVQSTSHKELVDGVVYVPQALTAEEYLPLPRTQPTVVLGERPAEAAGTHLDHV